ncbi:MAG: radical SAM protein [Candidatus Altiarchaeota archaeon]|nr:radical SAM protein [Candidatus Altiarchaeota archaeon]
MKIERTPYHSYKIKSLPKGCKLCVKGQKLVLFITGLCNRKCFYCPISDEKKDRDVIYANEWFVGEGNDELSEERFETILKESELSGAKGAGITGGDPLQVIKRTAHAIKRLKERFGKKFHIHLYTSPQNVTMERLKTLYEAGLDEIRFHPDYTSDRFWDRIKLAGKFKWDVGVEIPAIPEYEEETKKLIDYLNGDIDFLNLNELELSDSSANKLCERGYRAKGEETYAVEGSEETALRLMDYVLEREYKFRVHYCTVRLKDKVQLGKRIKKRSRKAATKLDIVTEEGLLIRGVIYLKETAPGFSYRKKLASLDVKERERLTAKLKSLKDDLVNKFGLSEDEMMVDEHKLRLIASRETVTRFKKELNAEGLIPAIVEEYPTRDALEVDIEFL